MKTLGMMTRKGGTGKSTAAISLAVCGVQAGQNVVLIDTDAQGTSTAWARLRQAEFGIDAPPPAVIQSPVALLRSQLTILRGTDCDLAIIDTAGVDSPDNDKIMDLSDLVVLPCAPSMPDIIATRLTYAKAVRRGREARFLLNKTDPRGSRLTEAHSCLGGLGSRWLPTPLMLRVDHMDAFAAGLGVSEYNPNGSAATEMLAVWGQIAALLDL